MFDDLTIAAIATSPGTGAIAVIRLSGKDSIKICERVFKPAKKGKKLSKQRPYSIHYGTLIDGTREVDQVLVSLFKSPHSYTGENVVEISCHGSQIIQQQLLEILIRNGVRLAQPGEFTLRAFINGKLDLSQAEAVADLIASTSEASRKVALDQMRGGFSDQLKHLREQLLNFTSLIELELDFGDEDVEFANRHQLESLLDEVHSLTSKLINSFQLGNVIKQGIPVTIAGKPNVGKSTLLNRLLNEEKAIVSEIAGTTRDVIEDIINLGGISFRFIDTAGLHHSKDEIESIGIKRAYAKISQAKIILLLIDAQSDINESIKSAAEIVDKLEKKQHAILLVNKDDKINKKQADELVNRIRGTLKNVDCFTISAKEGHNIELLSTTLINIGLQGQQETDEVIITNARHYQALLKARENLELVINGVKSNISGDILSVDIKQVINYLGEITGEITNDEVLGNIFSKFCIGK